MCLLFTCVTANHAWAQGPSHSRPRLLPSELALSIDQPPQAPRIEVRRLRRGRAFIATGVSLIAAGLVQALLVGRVQCSEPEEKLTLTRTLGGVAAGIGLSFVFGGTGAVLAVPRQTRQSHRMGGIAAGTTLGALLGTGLAWGALFLGSFSEFINCVSS